MGEVVSSVKYHILFHLVLHIVIKKQIAYIYMKKLHY